jgi:N-methylhydantoinase B
MSEARNTFAAEHGVDPISFEIIRETLQSIPDLVETDLTRTAFSPLIYEYKDYAVGLVDLSGRIIALARHGLPLFTASLIGRSVLDGIDMHGADGIHPGDVLLTNFAATIGQHLNNVVMYTPVFDPDGREIVAFMSIIAHWIDIGGRYPGSCSGTDTTELAQEGLQLRSVKLVSRGEPVRDIYRIIECNTRLPDMLLGDVAAQLAGCMKGRELFEELLDRHGRVTLFKAIETIWALSERTSCAAVAAIPNGTYSKSSFLDDDGIDTGKRIPLDIAVHIFNGRITVDYSDIGGQLRGPYNSGYYGGGETCARIAFKYLFTPHEPANEGDFAPLELKLPPGKFLSCGPNAPVGKYSAPLPSVIDTIIAAMAPVLPERVAGGHHASFGAYSLSGVHPVTGRYFNYFDTAHGGFGGSAHGDGVGPYKSLGHSDNKDIPVEVQEALYPVRVERHTWRTDSAGAGKFRGGLGVHKTFLVLAPIKANISFERFHCPPWGVFGGHAAQPGRVDLQPTVGPVRTILKGSSVVLEAGDRFHVLSGGGGGYGSPLEREAECVMDEVRAGYISRDVAERDYGVVLNPKGDLDEQATLSRRID